MSWDKVYRLITNKFNCDRLAFFFGIDQALCVQKKFLKLYSSKFYDENSSAEKMRFGKGIYISDYKIEICSHSNSFIIPFDNLR